MIWLLSILIPMAHGGPLLSRVGSCSTPNATKNVEIIKQWHLAPKTITKGFKEKYPQERNQTAIYQALSEQIKKKKVQLVVAEGCEGEINSEFKPAFNGWDFSGLHKISQTKGFERILAHVPLKLEARFEDKVLTLCGDNEALIQEGNLRMSNLRGWVGFWMRLRESGSNEKDRLYAESAADLLKIPKDTPTDKILPQIRERIKVELEAFKKSLSDRNEGFVKALQGREFTQAAIVIGGLHAEDLKNKLQAAGFGCEILQPPGYQKEDEELLGNFEKILDSVEKNGG